MVQGPPSLQGAQALRRLTAAIAQPENCPQQLLPCLNRGCASCAVTYQVQVLQLRLDHQSANVH